MSSSFISLTPLIDAEMGIYCHMLEIDNTRILINCGTLYTLDTSIYDPIMPQVLSCDVVLLTSFNVNCIGALSYIVQNNYYNKIFSSAPIKTLGRICLEEHVRGVGINNVNVEHFDRITEIKYSQPIVIDGVEICAYNAGNSIGGCLYKITKGMEKVVIGFNVNHRKENHLSGMNLASIASPSLCVFNTNHVLAENISVLKRDETLRSAIENAISQGRKIILPVRYSRFLEIALVLNTIMEKRREKAVCLSYFGRKFTERARSMIEWAGEKVHEMFSEEKISPFDFEHIEFVKHYSMLPDSNVIIVIDEGVYGCGMTTVLNRFNDGNNVLLLTDHRTENVMKDMSGTMKYYNFKLLERIVEKQDVRDEILDADAGSEPSDDGVALHWSESKYEIWCEDGGEYFPSLARRRAYDDYGEYVDRSLFAKEIVPNEEVEENEVSEESMIEEKEVAGEGIVLNYKVVNIDFTGVSDLNSCKTILESLAPKKLVCVGEDPNTGRFFYHAFKYMSCFEDVYRCKNKIILSMDTSMRKVKLSRDFCNINYQRIGNELVGKFKGLRIGDTVNYLEDTPEIMLGYIDMNGIRRSLTENNMRVDQDKNGLIVEDSVWVKSTADGVMIDGEDSGVFYAVRNAIYKSIAFI